MIADNSKSKTWKNTKKTEIRHFWAATVEKMKMIISKKRLFQVHIRMYRRYRPIQKIYNIWNDNFGLPEQNFANWQIFFKNLPIGKLLSVIININTVTDSCNLLGPKFKSKYLSKLNVDTTLDIVWLFLLFKLFLWVCFLAIQYRHLSLPLCPTDNTAYNK